MKTSIYVLTHKPFTPPPDPTYIPLSVHESSGIHIAEKNDIYSELTGLYWIWKNDTTSDIVGTAHYRRYLLNADNGLLCASDIASLLTQNDCITTKALVLNYRYRDAFCAHHKPYYLNELRKVLLEKYPTDVTYFDALCEENRTYFSNILITRKPLYNDYCSWLFNLFFTMEERITIDEPDAYHRRIFGFLSEFLWYYWVKKNGLKAAEMYVGMTNEKVETKELKSALIRLFQSGDYRRAKTLLLESRSKRPDILMEASDITGELHLCMEVISICEFEAAAGHTTLLERIKDYDALMDYVRNLNAYTAATAPSLPSHLRENKEDGHLLSKVRHPLTPQIKDWYASADVSDEALYVSRTIFGS